MGLIMGRMFPSGHPVWYYGLTIWSMNRSMIHDNIYIYIYTIGIGKLGSDTATGRINTKPPKNSI